ncbi:zinc-ribbon and DUF3426 domain-containing protein [Pelomonas sp. UHG3]|uniref:Zinc-ribbon and DUF3426 domain-containing protein n=1 Tax=Roseateles hydrophilus TaxID=2975054 RepID=A0ACC6C4Y0_9BURK|nr:zinc-ribbon and DUF3426 domain-containing protein [Pelomonas sp. UHG3]MCY4743458.1 zinc-ribbon and DUF3426 domain-containing protein [Pelomonas sp. UHG3]
MSLATRCTACGTIFRIVEDQLRVSDGWVRCGRCAEIFDARELLFDIEQETPPPWPAAFVPPPAPAMQAPLPPPPAPQPPPAPEPSWMPPPEPEPRIDPLPTGWPPADDLRQEPRWEEQTHDLAPEAAPPASAPAPDVLAAEPRPDAPAAAPIPVPEFMRRAETAARWQRPGVRLALIAATVLLTLLLLLQIALHFRHALAALHPPLRAGLQALCSVAGCEVQAWQRIDALSIDATSLNPLGSSGYKLNLTLRNKTAVDVAPPWLELSLTDAQGAPLARRVIAPEALLPSLQRVNADSEQALSFSFSTGTQRVSGYSVVAFYP